MEAAEEVKGLGEVMTTEVEVPIPGKQGIQGILEEMVVIPEADTGTITIKNPRKFSSV